MKTLKEIMDEVNRTFSVKWDVRDGRKVPEQDEIKLSNDAVKLDATVLYADLTDSTDLVNGYKDWFAAEIYKTYLVAACHIIRNNDGEITAFDGDRVMAVFIEGAKNTAAVKAALQINYIVDQINVALKQKYPNSAYRIKQTVGVDTSPLLVARTGIRNSNDLVWVGRAANYAAKLCGLGRKEYPIHITESVFNALLDSSKYGGTPRRNMWEKTIWVEKGLPVYKSSWWWAPS